MRSGVEAWTGRFSTKSIALLRTRCSAGCSRPTSLDDDGDPDASCRAWVRALAENGWLRACVPDVYGGVRAGLDVRTLCLARERLADFSALGRLRVCNARPRQRRRNAFRQRRTEAALSAGRRGGSSHCGLRAFRARGRFGRCCAGDPRAARRRRVRPRR